mgnify:CR=1 FL=1
MKLHVFPPSPNAKKVMMAADEAGVPVEIAMVDLTKGEHKTPMFLALNPNGKMPVLEFDDGSSLWESNAIVNKLADMGGSDLFPKSDARFPIVQWQFWEMAHWAPAVSVYVAGALFGRPIDHDTAKPALDTVVNVLNTHLSGREWLVGDAMTTADISVAAMLCYREESKLPLGDVPNIDAWLDRVSARESWKRVMKQPEPA